MRLYRLLALSLVVVLILSACGGEEEDAGLTSSSSDNNAAEQSTEDSANVPAALLTDDPWVARDGLSDYLAYVHGTAVYLARFDGEEPVQVTESIYPSTLGVAPDGEHIFYNDTASRRHVRMANVETLEVTEIARVTSEYGFLGPWSPNGEWALIFNFPTVYAARLDGSGERLRVGAIGGLTLWLADNTVLIVEPTTAGLGAVPNTIRRFDPATNEDMPLPDGAEQALFDLATNQNTLQDALDLQNAIIDLLGVEPAFLVDINADIPPQYSFNGPPPNAQGVPERCGTWEIQRQEFALDAVPETLYSVDDTLFLTNLSVREDGSILFLRWYLEDCDIMQRKAALMFRSVEGDVQVLSDAVDPGTSTNLSFFFGDTGNRMSLSSDERYVVWIGGNLESGQSRLNLTDLQTGETVVLLEEIRSTSNASTFHIEHAFTAVIWVPR